MSNIMFENPISFSMASRFLFIFSFQTFVWPKYVNKELYDIKSCFQLTFEIKNFFHKKHQRNLESLKSLRVLVAEDIEKFLFYSSNVYELSQDDTSKKRKYLLPKHFFFPLFTSKFFKSIGLKNGTVKSYFFWMSDKVSLT